jgi:PAS domain S-box-containing protein
VQTAASSEAAQRPRQELARVSEAKSEERRALLQSTIMETISVDKPSEPKTQSLITARPDEAQSWRSLLTAILDSSTDAIISKDLHGVITSWNQAASEIFGYPADEIIGQSILRIIPPELHAEEESLLARLNAGENIERFETARLRRDGQSVEISIAISPIRDGDGNIVGVASISHDISDRKRVERMLIRSEKLAATGRMAATVAHEINNPLESVLNFVYLARRTTPASEKAHEYLLSAEGELDRVTQIIRRVLGYYGDTSRQDEVFLHEILAEALAVYQAQLHANGIAVDCRYEDHRKIAVAWNEFAQVFSTILSDSILIAPKGAGLRFDVEDSQVADQQGIQLSMHLRAPALDRAVLDRAFGPLAAVQSKISSSMSLSVARELLEKRGAQVSFQNRSTPDFGDAIICIFVPFV